MQTQRIRHRVVSTLSYVLAAAIALSASIAILLWASSDPPANEVCGSDRDGLVVMVTHRDGKGATESVISYETKLLSKVQAPAAVLELGSDMLDLRGRPTRGTGTSLTTVSPFELPGGRLRYAQYDKDGPGHFTRIEEGTFPFDRQVLYLYAAAQVHMADGRIVHLDGPDRVCLRAGHLFRAQAPVQVDGKESTYKLTVTRQPWFIALVICAVLLVWVPFVVAIRTQHPHGPLELIATMTYAAAIRGFLTADAPSFNVLVVDVFIFLPLLLLAVFQLLRQPPSDKPEGDGAA